MSLGSRRLGPELPLFLLAAMVAIALIVEPLLYGVLLWQSKLPLALLLAWSWFRPAA